MQEAHSHNASIVLFFRPQKLGVLFSLHQSVFDAIFHFNSTFALLTQKNAAGSVLGALKSILDRHLDLFVFLEAKMQGYNRAPLFDRLNRYSQVAFLFSSSTQGFISILFKSLNCLYLFSIPNIERKSLRAIILSPVLRNCWRNSYILIL